MKTCDLLIIGGGIVGLTVAREWLIRHRPRQWLCWKKKPILCPTEPVEIQVLFTQGFTTVKAVCEHVFVSLDVSRCSTMSQNMTYGLIDAVSF